MRKFVSLRLIAVSALATISTLPLMFFTFLLLIGLFTERGPGPAVEPQWAIQTTLYAPIVVTSCVAGALYDGALPKRLWPHFSLGFLTGVFLDSLWLALQLRRGEPFSSVASPGYLIHPLLGASGSLLSGVIRRLRWQDYLDT